MKRIVVIGAGIGGLATALRLRQAGLDVTVVEKGPRTGGRANLLSEAGFRADTGPTILVMRKALDALYGDLGQNADERLGLRRIEPNYRIFFHDGEHVDLWGSMPLLAAEADRLAPGSADRVFQFLGEGAYKYEHGMPFVDRNYDHLTDLANPGAIWRLLSTGALANLYGQVQRHFGDDRLAKAFSFHSMFLGLSPMAAPAMYSLITYADLSLGMWYPRGGMYGLVEDLTALAGEMGVEIRLSAPAAEIEVGADGRARGVRLESGATLAADAVVCNADLPYAYRRLVDPRHRRHYTDARLDRMDYACSGYVLHLGLDRRYPGLRHQSLYFAQDYRANLDAIFEQKRLPADPSFHLCVPTVTDPTLAPPGHTLIYVLAPMPNLSAGIEWGQAAAVVREQLLSRLEQLVDPEIRAHIVWQREYRPPDWERDINAVLGTAFGSLSHKFLQSAYFRPNNKSPDVKGLYFAGQGTYPGIGIPMVLISARLVTERLMADVG